MQTIWSDPLTVFTFHAGESAFRQRRQTETLQVKLSVAVTHDQTLSIHLTELQTNAATRRERRPEHHVTHNFTEERALLQINSQQQHSPGRQCLPCRCCCPGGTNRSQQTEYLKHLHLLLQDYRGFSRTNPVTKNSQWLQIKFVQIHLNDRFRLSYNVLLLFYILLL